MDASLTLQTPLFSQHDISPDLVTLLAEAAEGPGHMAAVTQEMIDKHEKEKKDKVAEKENKFFIRYIPKQPHHFELALGLPRGTIFTEEDNRKAQSDEGFFNVDPENENEVFPQSRSCSALSEYQCSNSGNGRCFLPNRFKSILKGRLKSSCEINETAYLNKLFTFMNTYSIPKDIPVRAVLLDTAKLLNKSDVQNACRALVVQFQRAKVSYGDMLAAIYMTYICQKFKIQPSGCKQVRRYLWAMARGDKRTARIDFKSRIMYIRELIDIGPNDTVP